MSQSTHPTLMDLYRRLAERFGPQHWWPGDSRLEIIVGAILTQNTNWTNVEKAIGNLKAGNLLSLERLSALPLPDLADYIRPAGYYRVKAQRLRYFLDWILLVHGGQLDRLDSIPTETLRADLLSVKGIGPETADSILLYALDRPVFVVDTYTARIIGRHGLLEPPFDYEALQDLFHRHLPRDVRLFNEYHALLVRTGKDHCKPRPLCKRCPLEHLPHTLD